MKPAFVPSDMFIIQVNEFRHTCAHVLECVSGTRSFHDDQILTTMDQLDILVYDLMSTSPHPPPSKSSPGPHEPHSLVTVLQSTHHQTTSLVLSSMAECVALCMGQADKILVSIGHNLSPLSSKKIALAARRVLDSVRRLISPGRINHTVTSSVHVERDVALFVQCFSDFAACIYDAVHFAASGLPLHQLDITSSQHRSLYSPYSPHQTGTYYPADQNMISPTRAPAPTQSTVRDPSKPPTGKDFTTDLLAEINLLLKTQENITERRRCYLQLKERELLQNLNNSPPETRKFYEPSLPRSPALHISQSVPNLFKKSTSSDTLNIPSVPVHLPPEKSTSINVINTNPSAEKPSIKGARNPYVNIPLFDSNYKNRHRFEITRVDLTGRTERECRACNDGFSFLEKRIVCKDCRLTLHRECYSQCHPEKIVCECHNSPEHTDHSLLGDRVPSFGDGDRPFIPLVGSGSGWLNGETSHRGGMGL